MASKRIGPGLSDVAIFGDLLPSERAVIESELETIALDRGRVLVRQGDVADALFIVLSGRFDVSVAGRDNPIAEVGPGSPVGEIAFLAGGVRTATVTAARDSLVLKLGREQFDRLCARTPAIWRTLTSALARRLADQTAGRAMPADAIPRTITIIPAGPRPVLSRFVSGIEAVLRQFGSVTLVRSDNLRRMLGGQTDLNSGAAMQALNALESAHQFVIYLADSELTPWSEKAIRQADQVLRVGMAARETTADVPQNRLEEFAASLLQPKAQRLVLLHDSRGPVTGTAHWLKTRNVGMHHHVALIDRSDIDRLGRFITGNALGFVACGGGAFCAAHVGLYKAFLECGLTFDIMGGTSGGSAMTGAFAMGLPPDDVDRATHDIFVTRKALRRYTWPRYSLLDHTHFDNVLAEHYADVAIEDLWIPYFAISTNLSSHGLHRHTRGDLWAAIRASGSIPALLPPYYTDDGQMLVDGCLLDNVPIRSMHELKGGPNIVVSFEVPQLERFSVDYHALPSRQDLVRRALVPFRRVPLPNAPGLGSVLMRSLMVNRQDFERHLTPRDLLMVPPLPRDMGILEWNRHSELMQTAYRWAMGEIPRLQAEGHPALVKI
ncbi:MAG: patatin-like phospholipase family protein [Hyphomicrobiaceae bacterium]